jgi:hypothetical protein
MSEVSIPIKTSQFLSIVDLLRKYGSDHDPVAAVSLAIDYWMENAIWKAQDLIPGLPLSQADRGYSWKGLFLPHGSVFRMKYRGSFHYAKVEGDYLKLSGERLTPSEFAHRVTGTARNAWRDLWIKRPGDHDYALADDLRRALPARSFEGEP